MFEKKNAYKKEKALLNVLTGKEIHRTPVWLIRQAGRYLPEYQELYKQAPSFLDLCLTPSLASEATLLPVRRFDVDAAIVFADILLVPYAFGRKLQFSEKKGPQLEPVKTGEDLKALVWNIDKLSPVFETLLRMKAKLPVKVTRLGLTGGLWTLCCYMIDGSSHNGFRDALTMVREHPGFIQSLIEIFHHATLDYIEGQIKAGAEAIQIFDSWAGLLRGETFSRWVIAPTQRLVDALRHKYPNIPVIGFPRGAQPEDYENFLRQTGVDALGLDSSISLDFAHDHLKPIKPLQGNLAPSFLVKGGEPMQRAVDAILTKLGPYHIVNLGQGILPETPPEHVAQLVNYIRSHTK